MATLKDVVGKLEENNQKLGNIDTSIDKVEAGILGLFGLQKRAQLDQLEASREAGQSAKNVATLGNEPKGKGAGGDPDNEGGLFSGLSSGAAGLLGGLTLSGLLRNLIKRSPFLLATVFGDEMASVLEGLGLEKEIAGSIGRGIQAAGIAGIISPRLAPIAGLLGVIIDDETANQLKAIKDDFVKNFDIEGFKNSLNTALLPLQQMFDELGFDFDLTIDSIPSFKEVLDWMRRNLVEGVQGISDILQGDFSWDNIGNALGLIGAVAFAFAPLRTITLAGGLLGGSIKGVSKGAFAGLKFLLGKGLTGALSLLGMVGSSLSTVATSNAASTATTMAAGAGKKVLTFAGRTLLSLTPAGLVLAGAGILGYFAGEMFKQTEAYAMLKKKTDDELASMPLGDKPEAAEIIGDSNRSIANTSLAPGLPDTTRLAMLQGMLRNPDTDEGKKAQIENEIKALRIKLGLEKPQPNPAAQNAFNDYNASQAMRGRGGGGNSFVDASTTNVGQSTTALVGSGTNSFDMNNPLIQRAMAELHG